MLLIPVVIKPSAIHGLGVFCVRELRKGMCVWMYRNPPDYRIPVKDIPENMKTHALHFGYRPRDTDYVELCGDQAMFINHRKTPNLLILTNGDMHVTEDLPAGTELTCNYYDLEDNPEDAGALAD